MATIHAADLEDGGGVVEVLIDSSIAEIFVNQGARYVVKDLRTTARGHVECAVGPNTTSIDHVEIYRMKPIWKH